MKRRHFLFGLAALTLAACASAPDAPEAGAGFSSDRIEVTRRGKTCLFVRNKHDTLWQDDKGLAELEEEVAASVAGQVGERHPVYFTSCRLNTGLADLEQAIADKGARYLGEWSMGCNNRILRPMLDTLFDEKIAGSFHLTPGNAYDECDNGNRSRVHWDLVQIQRPEYGGGEIYFDGELVRKDGRFLPADLQGLNAGL